MNTQNTPVHIKLWHRDFWLMAVASLLLTLSVYILLPVLPRWLMEEENFTPVEVGRSMGVTAFPAQPYVYLLHSLHDRVRFHPLLCTGVT